MSEREIKSLTRKQREILAELFAGDGTGKSGVDVRAYRARNPRSWTDLEILERLKFIRQDHGRYLVSLLAVVRMRTSFATAFRRDSELIYAYFKREYSRDQNVNISMNEISRVTGLPVAHTTIVVRFMLEANIWNGHNLSQELSGTAYVNPSEKVISVDFPRFRDVVNEMEVQRAANERGRLQFVNTVSVADIIASASSEGSGGNRSSKIVRLVKTGKPDYVDASRIDELKALSQDKYDLRRLLEICDEINQCHQMGCLLAVVMLVRSMIDHVPPIFQCRTFTEVSNNYSAGGKSFGDSMKHLEGASRKIADQYLHTSIRKSESLPNVTQVDFSPDVDVLLGEIVRVLRNPK